MSKENDVILYVCVGVKIFGVI